MEGDLWRGVRLLAPLEAAGSGADERRARSRATECCWLSAGDPAEAAQIALRCQELLRQPRAGEQVAGSWGSGAGLVLEETRAAMLRLVWPAADKELQKEVAVVAIRIICYTLWQCCQGA